MTTSNPSIWEILLGFLVAVGASIMDALGLNLLQLDHVKNAAKPPEKQLNEFRRPLWYLGLFLYIFSQTAGGTIALNFLKAQWVAPIGSVSLIFNFIFARVFVGTQITKKDIIGTIVIIVSVIWVVVFGGLNSNQDEDFDLERLKELMLRPVSVVYFSIFDLLTFTLFGITTYSLWVLNDEERKKKNAYFSGIETSRLQKYVGVSMASVGGLLASQTLLLAKSGVKLISISISEHESQFTDKISWFIVVALIITAVLQIYCLNTGLKLSDSVLVVPIFYGFYTALGLVNTIIYLDELNSYPYWALILVSFGISTLVYGVLLLSEAKEEVEGEGEAGDDENFPSKDDEKSNWKSTSDKTSSSTNGKADKLSTGVKELCERVKSWFTVDSIKSSTIGRAFGKGFTKLSELRSGSHVRDNDKVDIQMEDVEGEKPSSQGTNVIEVHEKS